MKKQQHLKSAVVSLVKVLRTFCCGYLRNNERASCAKSPSPLATRAWFFVASGDFNFA
jgi:hypothetical protein